MLLLLDLRFDGIVRERLLISYLRFPFFLHIFINSHHILRYKGHAELENLDGIAKLIERTGFVANRPGPQRVPNYPEKYFARVKMPRTAVKVLGIAIVLFLSLVPY